MRWHVARLPVPRKAASAAWALFWLMVLWSAAGAAWAQNAPARATPPTILLEDHGAPLRAPAPGLEWTDVRGTATLQQVLAGQGAFRPLQPERIHVLGAHGALWLHLRLARPAGSNMDWMAEIPLPPLDAVTVYQQDAAGAWTSQAAGDKLAVSAWPEPGRFPVFRLDVPPGQARDLYLRIAHNARSSIPLRIASVADHDQRMQLGYLGLGLVFGGLTLVIAACLAQSWIYRDRVFLGYAAYASMIALALAAYTGAGSHLLWPHSATLADLSQGGLALLSAAASIRFIHDLSGISARAPRLARFARWAAWAVPVLLLAYVLLERPLGTTILGTYLALACLLNLTVAACAWRDGDTVSLWILAAYLPLAAALALTLSRVFGLAPANWANQYGLVAAMAVQVPLLLVALNMHSRERHGATIRELALSSQDALTGLPAAHLFHDRLRQLVTRHRRNAESAAVLFVDLVNYQAIKDQHGSAVAEQSLLRGVIKLRRMLREGDTLSRIGEARFGLMLERTGSRVTVTDRAAQVIAAGKMTSKGQKPEVGLQFHVAVALLDEVNLHLPQLTAGLATLLDSMAPTTSRPIRFLGAPTTQPHGIADTAFPGDNDSTLPLREGRAPG